MDKKLVIALVLGAGLAVAWGAPYLVVTEEYPPFEYLENGKPAGCDVEIIEAAAKKAGIEVKIDFVPWARAENSVKKGSADAIMCLFNTEERRKFLKFPSTHLNMEKNVIFANASFTGNPKKLADLAGMTIGVSSGYSYGDMFDSFTDYVKEESNDNEKLLRKLEGGRTPLAIVNEAVGKDLIKSLGIKNVRVLPIELGATPLYIAFSKAAPRGNEFFAKMEAALIALQKSGELDAIRRKYF